MRKPDATAEPPWTRFQLLQALRATKMSRIAVTQRLGLPEGTLGHYLRGRRLPYTVQFAIGRLRAVTFPA